MALVILNNVGQPFCFDGYDSLATTMLGGEVATIVAYQITGSDKHAKDVEDGYVEANLGGGLQLQRPIATTVVPSTAKPLYLTDDGTSNSAGTGYGTLFGSLVGGFTGQVVTGGTVLGPSTFAGSGKVTLWSNPGLYGVTLDAVDTASDGLVATNTALFVGVGLTWAPANGKLTAVGSTAASGNTTVCARLVEFSASDTLVTTPKSLTRLGVQGGPLAFKYAVINWNPPVS